MLCDNFFKGRGVWKLLLGATFVCCIIIIYNILLYYETRCTSKESCSYSHHRESARLSSGNCRTACNTKECIDIANDILNNMNRSADPCKDFNTFACGNYGGQFERESNHSVLLTLVDDINMVIKDIIETSNETEIDGSAAHKLKIVYDSCINLKSSDLSAIRSMQTFLNQMGIPNWPHLDSNFSFRNTTFEEIVGKLVLYQENIFLRFVDESPKECSLQEQGLCNVTVVPPEPTYLKYWEAEDLKNFVIVILHYTGMDNEKINRTWEEFKEVDKELRYLSRVYRYTNTREEAKAAYTDCSQKNASEIMLCRIWDSVVRNGRISAYVNKDLVQISFRQSHYIEKFPSVLSSYNHRTLAHYIALRLFINNLKYMSFSIRKNLKDLFKQLPSQNQQYTVELDHWTFCVSWVTENMKLPLGLMYVNRMWKKEAIDELDDIVNEYNQTIIQSIQEQDWIDEDDKQPLIQEVKEVKNVISLVIELYRNATKINSNYKKFHPTRNDFFRNVMNHKRFQFIGKYNMTNTEVFVQSFAPFGVSAYGGGGTIDLSFGALLPPLFNYGYPKLFNIARIGEIIGHEFGHGIMGFLSSYNDNLDNATKQHVGEIEECFMNQYFSYESKRIKQNVKGNDTLNENLCDNMSTKITEKIAEQLIRNLEANNFTLPGLPYSPEELFYLSRAQVWCETRSIEMEYLVLENDRHSPMEYRLIGTLQNSRRFSEVFHCPSTSYMNPLKKCDIFD